MFHCGTILAAALAFLIMDLATYAKSTMIEAEPKPLLLPLQLSAGEGVPLVGGGGGMKPGRSLSTLVDSPAPG